ncbi:hypothetical protein GE061_014678, partial [Apolygus lucorum]
MQFWCYNVRWLQQTFGSQSRITMSQEFNNLFNLEGAVLNADQASASTSSGQTSSGSGRNTNMVWDSGKVESSSRRCVT